MIVSKALYVVSFFRGLGCELIFKSRRLKVLTHSGTAVLNPSFLLKVVTSFQEELKKFFFFKEEYGVLPGSLNFFFSFSKVK